MSAPRTVLLCSQSASVVGGVEEWLDQLCAGLDPRRWRPIVALVRGARAHDPDRFRAAHPDLETVEIDGRGLPQESRVRAVIRCVRSVGPSVFVPLVVADAHVAAARLRAAATIPRYLLTLHGNTAPQLLHARELAPFADLAVGPGRLTSRLLERLGMPGERIDYIPNGARPPQAARRERGPGEPLRLGYVGRLSQGDKRVRDLVPLVRSLAASGMDFQLTIAGDGPERERLVSELAQFPVRFLGALPPERLYREVYPELDVLLLFSRSEAFGIALVEAMQHGVVPVCSDFMGRNSERIVEHGSSGLVFPIGDSQAAATLVRSLADDPALLLRLGVAGRVRVEERFTWSRCVSAWDAALERCLSLEPRQVPSSARVLETPVGRGRIERMGLPAPMVDAMRRLRRTLLGVPAAMHGGEEWPWVPLRRKPEDLEEMRRLRADAENASEVVDA